MTLSGDATLTLEATGPEAASLGAACRMRFRASGGTIGRTPENDWVLPHALVSGHHADITYNDGVFFITDTSTNGVFFGSLTNRLSKGHPTPIDPGQLIIIQPFRIRVSVGAPAAASPFAGTAEEPVAAPARPAPALVPPVPFGPAPIGPAAPYDPFSQPEPVPAVAPDAEEVDPLVALGLAGSPQPVRSVPRAEDLERASPLDQHFRPPAALIPEPAAPQPPRGAAIIPEDYDPLRDSGSFPAAGDPFRAEPARPAARSEPARPHQPAPEAATVAAGSDLAQVLAGAGLPDAAVPPTLGRDLGAILRVVVAGVMDLLRARQQIKDEFRMQATRFRAEDNNALKFSANVSDALHNLLVKRNPAYLGAVDSFEDAFDDLRNHQLAMLFAMRAAFESMLAEFGPERLQSQFERRVKKKSLLGSGPEAEYWELYRERAEDLARDVEETYRKLFGDRFVEAYEEQLERLSTGARRERP